MGEVAGGLRVIGAGFGRTGTMSLRVALDELGFGPTFHGQDIHFRPSRTYPWAKVANGQPGDWDEIFRGFHSALDYPVCCVWRDLAEHYPDAKIVLTVRDPESWWESTRTTIYPARNVLPAYLRKYVPFIRTYVDWQDKLVWDGLFDGRFLDREHAIKVFEQHTAEVRATADPDRLLVYNVAEGWEPLCEFLGVPAPDHPFPRLNSTAELQRSTEILRVASRVVPPALAGAAALGLVGAARRLRG
jgi:hypothetical protein